MILDGKKRQIPGFKGANYYQYGWNGYGFVSGSAYTRKAVAQITQLGYPAAIGDKSSNVGGSMVRTDSNATY